MNIRKILNITNKKHNQIINDDIEQILSGCDSIASIEWKEQKENQVTHDGQCPRCKDKASIVDKISHVKGRGKVGGDFKLGFGSINGSMNIDTDEINHCNKCGHEWKKFKTKYVSKTDIIRVALNYLGDILKNPEVNKNYSWKHDAIKVFENSYAESIKSLILKHKDYLKNSTIDVLSLKVLRKKYKSIFDI